MTERLIKKFIADYEATEKPRVRENYGILSGCVGIAVNLLLFLLKIAAGMMSGAISIIADAFNNGVKSGLLNSSMGVGTVTIKVLKFFKSS